MKNSKSDFIIFKTADKKISVDVVMENETVWLTIEQMAMLFDKARSTITEHLNNIFKEEELIKEVVCRKFRHTTKHGAIENKTQTIEINYYNLDAIIAVGYRVNSKKATEFRIWATKILKEYIIKGFAMVQNKIHYPIN